MAAGRKAAAPSLLDAMGALVAFSPTAATRWIYDNPDERAKIRHLCRPLKDLLNTVTAVVGSGAVPGRPEGEIEARGRSLGATDPGDPPPTR